MILLCDEDVGTGVPRALHLVGYDARAQRDVGWRGFPDPKWLPLAGEAGWLVFSCNKRMLLVPEERDTIIRKQVGIVFLTNGEENLPRMLWLLLVKWPWLERIDQETPRPFAFFVSPTGRTSISYTYRGMRLSI